MKRVHSRLWHKLQPNGLSLVSYCQSFKVLLPLGPLNSLISTTVSKMGRLLHTYSRMIDRLFEGFHCFTVGSLRHVNLIHWQDTIIDLQYPRFYPPDFSCSPLHFHLEPVHLLSPALISLLSLDTCHWIRAHPDNPR